MLPFSIICRGVSLLETFGLNNLIFQRSLSASFRRNALSKSKQDSDPPKEFRKRPRASVDRTLTIYDKAVARNLAVMVHNVVGKDTPIMEMHPGPGYLSNELLEAGFRNIFAYEPRRAYQLELKSLFKKYNLEDKCLFQNIYSLFHCNGNVLSPENFEAHHIFPFSISKGWDDSPAFCIVGAHSCFSLWLWILLNLTQICMYHNLGRPQAIMTFPRKEWEKHFKISHINTRGRHFAASLFPEFFEWEILGNASRTAFVQWTEQPKIQTDTTCDESSEEMIIVSISPSRSLCHTISYDGLRELRYFVEQHFNAISKTKYVIPTLEQWIPGCGKTMILYGFEVTQKFKHLSCKEIITLFQCFKSHPDYKSSAFVCSMKEPVVKYLARKKRKKL